MSINVMVCAAALFLFSAGGALAFDAAAPAPTSTGPAAKPRVDPGPEDAGARTAKSIECSQKADAQNLHGKPRKHFISECKHGA